VCISPRNVRVGKRRKNRTERDNNNIIIVVVLRLVGAGSTGWAVGSAEVVCVWYGCASVCACVRNQCASSACLLHSDRLSVVPCARAFHRLVVAFVIHFIFFKLNFFFRNLVRSRWSVGLQTVFFLLLYN